MSQTFSLQGKLGLDARDFKKGAQEASDAIGDVADELDELPAAGKKAGGDAGGLLSSGMAKGFAAAGGAAFIAAQINEAMNIDAGLDRVTAQFALTAEEAEKYGKLGGDLYADAWGESVVDATQSIAKVGQQLQEVGSIADDELDDISAQVMAVADVFQQDFDSVLRSSGQLIRNGLAKDATEALDLITVAFQQGGDRAGDLLDTIDEYSQHWARLGIDGSEALGLIVEGFQQGFRDGDKLADLFKEFSIRALEDRAIDAFEAIGLAGQSTQDAIAAGGESARAALDDVIRGLKAVEDPIEQNRIATELFGTQYEDLGPQVLDVLDDITVGLGDVEGASAEMAETVSDNTAASFEEMKRRGLAAIQELAADALPILDSMFALAEGDFDSFEQSGSSAARSLIEEWNPVTAPFVKTKDAIVDGGKAIFDMFGGGGDASEAVANFSTIIGGAVDPSEKYAKAADLATAATEDVGGAADDAADDIVTLMESFQDLVGEISDRSAYRDLQQSFQDVRDAKAEMMDTADKTWSEQQADAREYAQSVDDLRLEVIGYADEVGDLPEEAVTDVLAKIDSGTIDNAEWAIAWLVRDRNLRIQPVLQDPRGVLTTLRRAGTPDGMLASGGPAKKGKGYIVGEEGPEWFEPDTNGYVHPADVTAAAMGGGGMILPNTGSVAATTIANTNQRAMINLTVHSLDAQNAGRVIVETLNEFYQSGGQRP